MKSLNKNMTLKEQIINGIIDVEGGYTNNPDDSGGETKFGITKQTARKNGYQGDMKDLPYDLAFTIYEKKYWDSVKGEDLEKIAGERITKEIVDTAVNISPLRSSIFLQRSLNTLNNKGSYWPDIKVDGIMGSNTLKALKAFISRRKEQGKTVLLRMLNSLQGSYYIRLTEYEEKDETFLYGWFLNRVS